jgi:outer membrane protein insertion porin family
VRLIYVECSGGFDNGGCAATLAPPSGFRRLEGFASGRPVIRRERVKHCAEPRTLIIGLVLLILGTLCIQNVFADDSGGPPDSSPVTVPPPTSPAATEPSAEPPPPPPPETTNGEVPERDLAAASALAGRRIEAVRIIGNTHVSTAVIRELTRTREGDKFDPATVVDDYERIYERMRMFANVVARVQQTPTGVIVIFIVTEQKQIHEIRYIGNKELETKDLEKVVDLHRGEAIERFRINLAQQAIQNLYREKNFPFAHITYSLDDLTQKGDVIFQIVEGPRVYIRKIDFIGNSNFTVWRLKDQVKSGIYIWIFQPGTFDPDRVDADVLAIQQFYTNKGFFDVRVGRRLTLSPDMREMQLTFVIDEGPRYNVDRVEFRGIKAVSEGTLRKSMKLLEGNPYDKDAVDLDVRQIVRDYSKVGGYVYEDQPGVAPNPDYLQINPKVKYLSEPGKVDLIYEISEGKTFRLGRILVKGNTRTQDRVILREMRMRPGQQYDSAGVQDAEDRLKGLPYFTPTGVTITTIGDDPGVRDLLVEVEEAHTASISAGVGINSNGGLGGQIAYEQKNFDISNPPSTWGDLFSDRAFTGAGQDFQAQFAPSTQGNNASLTFTEPYLFDQPYSYSAQGYLEDRIRDVYTDDRLGGRFTLGQRFNYIYTGQVYTRVENVNIVDIIDPPNRAEQINAGAGNHFLTSAGLAFTRDTTNHGPITYQGTSAQFGFEDVGALGGTVDYTRLTYAFSAYETMNEDLLERKTVLMEFMNAGWDPRTAPFYDRFYAGGLGSLRAFDFREVSPRAGPDDDAIGGDFMLTGTVELDFPLVEDFLRGDVFVDAGDVEPQPHFGVIRSSAGFGFRLILPFFGSAPLQLDFGFPITQSPQDRTQLISFSFGITR